ncbi:MAG TPA: L,D-transpeptidase family protein, partial [Thermoanaerobaculia bacterium]|nr:L,D-transpeptidase family protein [Thermoanaerobaculia bacterium]
LQRAWKEMQTFYQKRNFQLAWSDNNGPSPRADELVRAIPSLAAEGLDVRRYQTGKLASLVEEVRKIESFDDPAAQRKLVELDAELTYTYLALSSHLGAGRLQPEKLRVEWYTKPRNVDLDAKLEQALAREGGLGEALRGLTPPHADYQRMRQALSDYKAIQIGGGWGAVPPGEDLKKGEDGPRVAALRARLTASGDLPAAVPAQGANAAAPVQSVFDDAVAAAVSRFQGRHGLEVTGKVDEDTLAELNVPVQDRIRQLQVNMERWRWMPASLGERYIFVNVPEFRLDLVEGGKPVYTMRVVVGKDQSRTPAFSDKMTYLELNPAWNIPDTIAREEILPKLASDPGYLARNNMEVIPDTDGRLRQRPGPDNPLGKIKFMFPNEYDIYLHDTPADHLFSRTERDFSHGCIRLEKPIEFANILLQGDPEWTPEALQAAIDSGEQKTITLPKPLPVHILYWTSWVEPSGSVQFRKDIYGHDEQLEKDLAEEPPIWLDLGAVRGDVRAAK